MKYITFLFSSQGKEKLVDTAKVVSDHRSGTSSDKRLCNPCVRYVFALSGVYPKTIVLYKPGSVDWLPRVT